MPQPAALDSLAPLYREAAEATSTGSKSFYFATRFFPPDLARAAHAVYWFCRTTDDLVDECPDPVRARADLAEWEQALRRALAGGDPGNPILKLFAAAVREYSIPHEYPLDLIAGMRMDLECRRYQTWEELQVFCHRVASVVGLMMMHVIGYRDNPIRYATQLGYAMQLTNILRDVGEDLDRGRIYLPLEEMRQFDYSEADLLARRHNAAFVRLMEFQAARAKAFYAAADPGILYLNSRGRFAVEIASRVYAGILGRIEASGYNVFEERAVVPAAAKYWITARTMTLPALRNSAARLAFWRS